MAWPVQNEKLALTHFLSRREIFLKYPNTEVAKSESIVTQKITNVLRNHGLPKEGAEDIFLQGGHTEDGELG